MDLDKAIKASAMDEPKVTGRKSAPRLAGEAKASLVAEVVKAKNVNQNYDHVIVFNYPEYDDCWDHMLINFYYTQDTDPATIIKAYRVYESGDITDA